MTGTETRAVTTKVPLRLDRLPWSRWHSVSQYVVRNAGCPVMVVPAGPDASWPGPLRRTR
jgi:hypothetical protein